MTSKGEKRDEEICEAKTRLRIEDQEQTWSESRTYSDTTLD